MYLDLEGVYLVLSGSTTVGTMQNSPIGSLGFVLQKIQHNCASPFQRWPKYLTKGQFCTIGPNISLGGI